LCIQIAGRLVLLMKKMEQKVERPESFEQLIACLWNEAIVRLNYAKVRDAYVAVKKQAYAEHWPVERLELTSEYKAFGKVLSAVSDMTDALLYEMQKKGSLKLQNGGVLKYRFVGSRNKLRKPAE